MLRPARTDFIAANLLSLILLEDEKFDKSSELLLLLKIDLL